MIIKFFTPVRFLLLLLPVFVSVTQARQEAHDSILELKDFKHAITQAKALNRPFMIEFSSPSCQYCEALEEEILQPILKNDDYLKKIAILKLEVGTSWLIDASGKTLSAEDFADKYDVDFFPTIIFFNGEGKEVSRRIIGITTIDYTTSQIDQAIDIANQQMKMN